MLKMMHSLFNYFSGHQLFTDYKENILKQNILHEQMENDVLFVVSVCVIHNVVAAVQGQIASIKFA